MQTHQTILPGRSQLTRLMKIWRSGGWPSHDATDIDLLAAGWVSLVDHEAGQQTLRLTDSGVQLLAQARHRNQRALSTHDRLGERMAKELVAGGRIVWRELSLRAALAASAEAIALPCADLLCSEAPPPATKAGWRIARPDLFSVRNTSVEAYLQPVVHEIKASRADLLSDLRHAAKRESYQWLCCECYYVFPAGIAEVQEIPDSFGVWVLHGEIEDGRLELLRPARHQPCTLPFAVWLALAKAAPLRFELDDVQAQLGAP